MMNERNLAKAAQTLLKVVAWVAVLGFVVAIVGGTAGMDASYRLGSFAFSAGLAFIYLFASSLRPNAGAESAIAGGNNERLKTTFGNRLTRWLRAGVELEPIEKVVLLSLVAALPAEIRSTVICQLEACNLVQREIDGRSLNFYRLLGGKPSRDGVPDLPILSGEVLLIKMSFVVGVEPEPRHATMHAVDKQFFCIKLSHDFGPLANATDLVVKSVTQSWRSNKIKDG